MNSRTLAEMPPLLPLYFAFVIFVLSMLAVDLFVVNRKPHEISVRAALIWTAICVLTALAFSVVVFQLYQHNYGGLGDSLKNRYEETWRTSGAKDMKFDQNYITAGGFAAMEFLSGWLIEYSLSMDNLFVIALIFAHFRIPKMHQHRVLFWGILGALVMRGVMIAAGASLIANFHWVLYIFGGVLIYTAWKILHSSDEDIDPEHSLTYRLARKILPFHPTVDGEKFFVRESGRLMMTPLFLVLLIVESTDVVFAIDSIPAIFAITPDPFLVFTSNIFAILGLRSLYFALVAMMERFRFIKFALAYILAFIGLKMLLEFFHIDFGTRMSFGVVLSSLVVGVGTSWMASKDAAKTQRPQPDAAPAPENA